MVSDVVKGGWAPDEDERLVNAIELHSTRWSLVASVVQTRNSDRTSYSCLLSQNSLPHQFSFITECAKRWTDTLNPNIDRRSWTAESVRSSRFTSSEFFLTFSFPLPPGCDSCQGSQRPRQGLDKDRQNLLPRANRPLSQESVSLNPIFPFNAAGGVLTVRSFFF